jgi:nitroreductase
MEAFDAIFGRRSVRSFTDQPVDDALVTRLLQAAMSAPSAGNEQPWHFLVITDRELLDAVPDFHPYAEMLHEAPLAILVCGDERLEHFKGFWVQDCAAATENLLLAAHASGLGAVWLGIHPVPERETGLRRLFGIPEDVTPFALVALGHPAETPEPADRYDESRVRRDRW